MENCLDTLKELGFEKAASNIKSKREQRKKLHIAYQNYEFVVQEDVDKFNKQLRKQTEKTTNYNTTYSKLVFIGVRDYKESPPLEILERMKEAVSRKCFDTFEIAKIEAVEEVKDPILFGKINGCSDRFFIGQWDNDVTLEQIKAVNVEA